MAAGETGDTLFIVRRGRLEVSRHMGGEHVILGELGEGEIVGEMAIFSASHVRMATVRAMVDSELIELRAEEFTSVLEKSPPIVAAVLKAVVRRLRSTMANISDEPGETCAFKHEDAYITPASLAHEMGVPVMAVVERLNMIPPDALLVNRDRVETLRRWIKEIS